MDLPELEEAIQSLPWKQQKALAKWIRVTAAQRARRDREEKAGIASKRLFYQSPALLWTIVSLLLFLIVEGGVFRLGWYNKYLEPESSAGTVEAYLYWLKRFPHSNRPVVMVVGDSRIAEGFSARQAGLASGNSIRYWNFGMGGTTPRVWYYILRDGDPTRRRFAGIVLALDQYSDEDHWDSLMDRPIDLNFVIGRLRLRDCQDYVSSIKSPEIQARTLSGCLLKGIALRRDAQEFLRHVSDRIARTKDNRVNGLQYLDAYDGSDLNLRGLSADFTQRTIQFPSGLTEQRHNSIQDMVMPAPAPPTGEVTRYRRFWLGRILDLYKDSPTRIVFLELPRAPLPRPESPTPARFLKGALKRPRVSALPSYMFRDLERPELFEDGLHLNKVGRSLFTERLADQVPPLIGIQ
jgi:hypothetical protein